MLEQRFWELFAKKLSGEATARELEELEQMMRTYPDLHYSAQHLEDLWELDPLHQQDQTQSAWQQHLEMVQQQAETSPADYKGGVQPRRSWMSRHALAGAILLLTLAVGTSTFLQVKRNERKTEAALKAEAQTRQIVCPPGSKTRILLPDSSTVWLNAGSKLVYNEGFGISNRNCTLTGEAFFDVKKQFKPFIIQAGSVQIRVVGTAFNVRAYPHEHKTETSLIRGRVEITSPARPDEKVVLKPNEKLTINEQNLPLSAIAAARQPIMVLGTVQKKEDSTILETAWMLPTLSFESENFADLARRMESWYSVKIVFTEPALKQLRFTGVFQDETIQQALEALQFSVPFHYTIKDRTVIIEK